MKRELAGSDALAELRETLPAEFTHCHPLSQAQYLESAHLLPAALVQDVVAPETLARDEGLTLLDMREAGPALAADTAIAPVVAARPTRTTRSPMPSFEELRRYLRLPTRSNRRIAQDVDDELRYLLTVVGRARQA